MLTTSAMAASKTAGAADWSGALESSLNAAYVINPRMIAGGDTSDETGVLLVDGSAMAQTERSQLTLTPRFTVTRYDHETDLNREDGSLTVNFKEKLERGQWTFDGIASTDSTITSELGTTGITYVNLRHNAGLAELGYVYSSTERLSWSLQVGGQIARYEDAREFGLTNYDYGSVQFGPSWNFSERVQGSLTLEADRLHPQTGARQNNYSASLQLQRSFSERYSWRASLGGSRVEYGSTETSASSASTSSQYEVGATYKGERVQWDLSARRAIVPIGIGLLAPQTVLALVIAANTSEHSTLSVSLNGIRSDAVFVDNFPFYGGATWGQAGVEWRHNFTTHWAFTVGYQQSRARALDVTEWANGKQAHVGVTWNSGRL
jgi:hypothetical protein